MIAPATAATPTEPTLTEVERRKFVDLEGIIKRGFQTFVEVGVALSIIREQELYRQTHPDFETYCRERWGWTANRARRLIAASDTVNALAETVPIGTLPTNEAQARELAKVPEEKRTEVWQHAVDESGGKPTAAAVKRASERIAPRPRSTPPVTPKAAPMKHGAAAAAAEPEVDPVAEWEAAQREVERLEDLVETLKAGAGKAGEELVALSRKHGQLEGRVRQLTTEANEAKRQAKSQGDLLRKIADKLGIERWGEILPAIEDLLR